MSSVASPELLASKLVTLTLASKTLAGRDQMKMWNDFVFHHRPAQHYLAAVEETVDNSLLDDFQEVESEIQHQASCTIGNDGLDDFSTVQPPLRSPPTAINDSRRPTSVAPATLPQSALQSRIRNSSLCPEPRPTD
ncbi:hypothetical protein FRC02_002310 [Tulasnella sp. 418]|nr:hypothetical protein FRC02_002310 [Tulasnella sp. 418]